MLLYAEKEMTYAIYLLPHIIKEPLKKEKKASTDKVASRFVQIYPISFVIDLSYVFVICM